MMELPSGKERTPIPLRQVSDSPPDHFLPAARPALMMGALLVASGLFHLVWMWITSAMWEGAVSPRKPALFGISAGVTVWSIVWVQAQMRRWKYDGIAASFLAACLLLEVSLITLQFWRGVPSHFNRATRIDAAIETVMLTTIIVVTIGIGWLCGRSCWLPLLPHGRSTAIRGGLWLLLVSCGLGFVATVAGELNIAHGRPPEVWGAAGVLKYPHGAALHAIQALAVLAAVLERLHVANANRLLQEAVAAHVLLLIQAGWQTSRGHARLDVDFFGAICLLLAFLLIMHSVLAIGRGLLQKRKLCSYECHATRHST